MRPIRRRSAPRPADYADYTDAKPSLIARLGMYCSYCERRIPTNLAVEHIQPKGLNQYAHLAGRWENFLLACVNCNSDKGSQDVILSRVLLPDRDNTFAALDYREDGQVSAAPGLNPRERRQAAALLKLTGLDRTAGKSRDQNEEAVALDRKSQRMQVWAKALVAAEDLRGDPGNQALRRCVVELARESGYFSIWMKVFERDAELRNRLIAAFPGTRESGCFDPATTRPVRPAPNPDRLPHGGKA